MIAKLLHRLQRRRPRTGTVTLQLHIDAARFVENMAQAALVLREMQSVARHRQAIARERAAGLAHVRRITSAARTQLGLEDPDA